MVGSVLMQRMVEEQDLVGVDATFFSTSQAGQPAPEFGQGGGTLEDAKDLTKLAEQDVIITCQGGDYTTEIHPQLRAGGWQGYWIDAASTLRMKDNAVLILDPINRNVIDDSLNNGGRDFIGGQLYRQPDADGDWRSCSRPIWSSGSPL